MGNFDVSDFDFSDSKDDKKINFELLSKFIHGESNTVSYSKFPLIKVIYFLYFLFRVVIQIYPTFSFFLLKKFKEKQN